MAIGNTTPDILILIETQFKKAVKDLDTYTRKVSGMSRITSKQFQTIDKHIQSVSTAQNRLKKLTEVQQRQFQGWALSIMFFGMALQRIFNTIWKSSTKTFQDVMHSVQGATTDFDLMQGALKYLQFTAGAALEPIAKWLVPIIDATSQWISENEEAFRIFTVVVGVLGTLFAAGGAGVLAVNGFLDLAKHIGKFASILGRIDFAEFFYQAQIGFNKITDSLTNMSRLLGDEIIGSLKWIKKNPLKGALVLGMVAGIVSVLIWIWKMQDAMGGFDEFLKSFVRGGIRLFSMLGAGIAWGVSYGVDWAVKSINFLIDLINKLLMSDFMKKGLAMVGITAPQIGKLSYERATWGDLMQKIIDAEAERTWLSPEKGYLKEGMTLEDLKNIQVNVQIGDEVLTEKVSTEVLSNTGYYS